MAAQITFNQPTGAGPGTAGKARNDIWVDQQVELVSSGTGTTFLWELLNAPPGSAATIADPTFSTATLTPDVMGSYRISLTVDGGGLGNKVTKVIRARYDNTGKLLYRGWALPAVDEEEGEADYGTNDRDWDEPWQGITTDARQSLTRTFVFQPGGTPGGNTFDTWADLMVAFQETTGLVRIVMDESLGAIHISSTNDLEGRGILCGLRGGARPTVYIDNWAFVQNPAGFDYVTVDNEAGSNGTLRIEAGTCYAVDSQFTAHGTALIRQTVGSTLALRSSDFIGSSYSEFSLYADYLDPTPAYVSMGTISNFNFEKTDPFTLSAWYKASHSGGASLIERLDADNQGYRMKLEATGALSFTLAANLGGGDYITWTTISTSFGYSLGGGAWHHIAVSYDGAGTATIYVDGVVEATTTSGTLTGTLSNTGGIFYLNKTPVGYLDDCAVYNAALGLSDVTDIYNGGSPNDLGSLASAANLVAWWKMGDDNGPFMWPFLFCHGLFMIVPITGNGSFAMETPGAIAVMTAFSTNGGLATIRCEGFSEIQAGTLTGPTRIDVYLEGYWATCAAEQPASVLNIYAPPSGFSAGGDLSGTSSSQTVIRIQGMPVDTLEPLSGNVLKWDGAKWTPGAAESGKVVILSKGVETTAVATPTSVGTAYIDAAEIPNPTYTVKLRVVMETTSGTAGYEAYMDLYDINGVLNSGTPSVVSGSQIDTGTGLPPTGGPTPNPLIPSAYETDVSAAFASLSGGGPGVFEARLWIGMAGGGNAVTCKSAELIFTW